MNYIDQYTTQQDVSSFIRTNFGCVHYTLEFKTMSFGTFSTEIIVLDLEGSSEKEVYGLKQYLVDQGVNFRTYKKGIHTVITIPKKIIPLLSPFVGRDATPEDQIAIERIAKLFRTA